MATLQRAIQIAVEAHMNVMDKSGKLYILHPMRIMLKAETEDEKIVAILHDVVEDCKEWTLDRMRDEGFSELVIDSLDRMTRRPGESYDDFIDRCRGAKISTKNKLKDIEDNMDMTRLPSMSGADLSRIKKYHKAWCILKEAEAQWECK